MKKKMILIGVMIFVCSGMFMFAKKAQNSYFNKGSNSKVEAASNSEAQEQPGISSESEKSKENTPVANNTTAPAVSVSQTQTKPSTPAKPPTPTTPTTPTTPAVGSMPIPQKDSNFVIIDEVNRKIILEKKIDFDNVTIDYITCKLLNDAGIKYGNEDEGTSTSYFYSIAGLAERKAGPLSGWCFYVNNKKPGLGAGSYIYHKGDVVVWKYLEDAINN